MRPRHKAAEYVRPRHQDVLVLVASMRPRHKAAEYFANYSLRGDLAALLQ